MQLLAEHKTLVDLRMNTMLIRDASSHYIEAKEKASNASLLMNPVASGDNVATGLNSAHKIKDELPPLVPCCEGRELRINEDLVCSGLSAISVKHDDGVVHCLSMSCACEKMQVPPGIVKHRNSFRSLHRPDLKRVPYLRRMTPEELEALFLGYSDVPNIGMRKADTNDQASNKVMIHSNKNAGIRDVKDNKTTIRDEGNNSALKPIPETRSGAEDVPAGMRLHGARARLYTSVLAGTKAGDQMENASPSEEYDAIIPDDILPDDEVQLNEELQIILPPRCDDIINDSSIMNSESVAC